MHKPDVLTFTRIKKKGLSFHFSFEIFVFGLRILYRKKSAFQKQLS